MATDWTQARHDAARARCEKSWPSWAVQKLLEALDEIERQKAELHDIQEALTIVHMQGFEEGKDAMKTENASIKAALWEAQEQCAKALTAVDVLQARVAELSAPIKCIQTESGWQCSHCGTSLRADSPDVGRVAELEKKLLEPPTRYNQCKCGEIYFYEQDVTGMCPSCAMQRIAELERLVALLQASHYAMSSHKRLQEVQLALNDIWPKRLVWPTEEVIDNLLAKARGEG